MASDRRDNSTDDSGPAAGSTDSPPLGADEQHAAQQRVASPYDASALPRFFSDISGPMWRYVLRMAALSLVPTILLAMAMAGVGLMSDEDAPQFRGSQEAIFVGMVVISPVFETLMMAVIFWALSLFTRNALWLAIMSCVIWGVLHSLAAPMWGFVVVWAFLVFSCAFLAWRQRSWISAIVVTTSIHALHNLLPALVFLLAMPEVRAQPGPEPPPIQVVRPAALFPDFGQAQRTGYRPRLFPECARRASGLVAGASIICRPTLQPVRTAPQGRTHQRLGNRPPLKQGTPELAERLDTGQIVCRERLGGLLKHYEPQAA